MSPLFNESATTEILQNNQLTILKGSFERLPMAEKRSKSCPILKLLMHTIFRQKEF